MNDLTKKKKYYEVLRIVAIFSVMFSHTPGFNAVGQANGISFALQMIFAIMTRVSVPTFFMVSGALLLGRSEPVSKTLKRAVRFALCLLLFSLLSYLRKINFKLSDFWLQYFITEVYSGMMSETYWFLYSYISFVLMLPFIRRLAQNMTNLEFKYMVAFVLAIGLIKILQFVLSGGTLSYSAGFVFFILETIVFYPLLGYYIEHKTSDEYFKRKSVAVLLLSSLCAYAITCLSTRYCISCIFNGVECSWSSLIDSLRIVIAFSVFYFAKYLISGDCSGKFGKSIAIIASCVFGAYLIEPVISPSFKPLYDFLQPHVGTFFASKIWCLINIVSGCFITFLLKRIPGIKKLL